MRATTTLGPIFILALSTGIAFGQARGISGNGFDSGGINIIPKTDPKKVTKKVKTIQYVAVSPERVWKSSDKKQKPITGSLLAFERETKTGKVSIVKDDKVRLLVEGLNTIPGVHCLQPNGTFYAFPSVSEICNQAGITSHGLVGSPPSPERISPRVRSNDRSTLIVSNGTCNS